MNGIEKSGKAEEEKNEIRERDNSLMSSKEIYNKEGEDEKKNKENNKGVEINKGDAKEEKKELREENKEEKKENTETDSSESKEEKSGEEKKTKIKDIGKKESGENREGKEVKKRKRAFSFNEIKKAVRNFYDKQYKKLLIIPFVLLFLALLQISIQTAQTGDFIHKGVSLKGGISLIIPTEKEFNIEDIKEKLSVAFPNKDINIRKLMKLGKQNAISIDVDVKEDEVDSFRKEVEKIFNITSSDYSVEFIGSSLGKSFFRETFKALIFAFIFMGIVVFLWFRNFIPSIAVILSAFSDIVVTIAIVNMLGIKLGTAGIAAFLMLIGYSVDTDILLSTKVLKRREGSVFSRVMVAMRTGMMMTLTTIIAVSVALFFAQSEVIRQIMLIIIIGLFVDLINTWIQNVGLLRLYVERKEKMSKEIRENE